MSSESAVTIYFVQGGSKTACLAHPESRLYRNCTVGLLITGNIWRSNEQYWGVLLACRLRLSDDLKYDRPLRPSPDRV